MALAPLQQTGVSANVRNPTPAEIAALERQSAVPPQAPPPGPPPAVLSAPTGPPAPAGSLNLSDLIRGGPRSTDPRAPQPGGVQAQTRAPSPEEQALVSGQEMMNPPPPPEGLNVLDFVNTFNPRVSAPAAKKFLRTVVPAIGSTIGGTLGARGGASGAMAASSVGAAAGEGVSMLMETAVGAPPSLDEIRTRFATDVPTAGIGEGVARTGIAWGKKLLGPFANKVTSTGREVMEVLGGHATPAQVVDSRGLAVIENILEGSFFGGGRYSQFLNQQNQLLRRRADEILNQFGPRTTSEEAGAGIRSALERPATLAEAQAARHRESAEAALGRVEGNRGVLQGSFGPDLGEERSGQAWQALQEAAHDAARSTASRGYEELDRIAAPIGKTISLQPLLDVAEKQFRRAPEMARAISGKPGALPGLVQRTGTEVVEGSDPGREAALRELQTQDPKMVQALAGPGQHTPQQALMLAFERAGITPETVQARNVTFMQAHRIRSEMGKLMREADRRGDGQLKFVAGQYFKAMDEAMTEAADEVPGLREAYDDVTAAWKQMVTTYEEGLLAEVADKEPRLVVRSLIQPGRVEDILKAKRAVGKDGWRVIQANYLDSLLRDPRGGWVTGAELSKRLTKLTPETLDAVFEKSGHGRLLDLVADLDEQAAFTSRASELSEEAVGIRNALKPAYTMLADAIKPGKVEDLAKLRRLVGTDDWAGVQSAFGQRLLRGKTPDTLPTGAELMKRLTAYGPETIEQVFPRGSGDGFWQLARVLNQLQSRSRVGGAGKTAIQLTQGGIIFGALSGGIPGGAAAILITPPMLVRAILTPLGRRYLTVGLKAPPGSAAAARAASNMLAFFTREGFLSQAPEGGVRNAPGTTAGSSGRGMGPGPNTGQGGPPPSFGAPSPTPPGPPRGAVSQNPPGTAAVSTLEALGLAPAGSTSRLLQGPPPGPPSAPGRTGGPPGPPGR